ncbi:unnamed protein product, partial [marine sediment metagenome]
SIVIVDFDKNPIYKDTVDFDKETDAQTATEILQRLIAESIQKSGIPRKKVLGFGIGSPGRIDIDQGREMYYAEIADMDDFPLKSIIERKFKIPVYINNNSLVLALSEYRYGEAKGIDSLLAILIRTGMGGSFISGGKIFVNQDKTALELGHMSVDINGRDCQCGAKGCLESYLSEGAIISDLQKYIPVKTVEEIENYLLQQEPRVISELEEKGRILARIARNKIENDQYISQRNIVKIIAEKYDPLFCGLGASDLVFDHFFDI